MEQKLKNVLADVLGIRLEEINKSITMESSDEWDSLKHLELITAIEEKFDVDFEIEEMIGMTTYENILNILKNK